MTTTVEEIIDSPHDYKLCKKCNSFNWYENDICHNCDSKSFTKSEKKILAKAKDYLDYDEDEDEDEDEEIYDDWNLPDYDSLEIEV